MFFGLKTVARSRTNLVTESTKLHISNNQSPRMYDRNTEMVLTKCQKGSFIPKLEPWHKNCYCPLTKEFASVFNSYLGFIHFIF